MVFKEEAKLQRSAANAENVANTPNNPIEQVSNKDCNVTTKTSLDKFLDAIRASVTKHAETKGYLHDAATIDGFNAMLHTTQILGIDRQHAVGEIIYKANEFLHNPEKLVLLEKIAGWAYIAWRSEQEKQRAQQLK